MCISPPLVIFARVLGWFLCEYIQMKKIIRLGWLSAFNPYLIPKAECKSSKLNVTLAKEAKRDESTVHSSVVVVVVGI